MYGDSVLLCTRIGQGVHVVFHQLPRNGESRMVSFAARGKKGFARSKNQLTAKFCCDRDIRKKRTVSLLVVDAVPHDSRLTIVASGIGRNLRHLALFSATCGGKDVGGGGG